MDIVDESFNEEISYVTSKIEKIKRNKPKKLQPAGYCYNCFEDLDGNKIFCDDKCAKQYEIMQKINPE